MALEENEKNNLKKITLAGFGFLAVWFGMVKAKAVRPKKFNKLINDWKLKSDRHGKKEKSSHRKFISTDESPCGPGIKVVFSTGSMARGTYERLLKDLEVPRNEWSYYM